MNLKQLLTCLFFTLAFFSIQNVYAQSKADIVVSVSKPVAEVQPTMWGIFFEDINFGADGGIYAELIKNRSFEFAMPLMGWTVKKNYFNEGAVLVLNRNELNPDNPRFVRITKNNANDSLSLTNESFRGMGITKNLRYDFSVLCRPQTAGLKMHIELLNAKGEAIGGTTLMPSGGLNAWKEEAVSFNATDTAIKGQFRISFEGAGEMDLDMISLFPSNTWKNRPGGMRRDMIQLLADMKPGFIRFPGGCIVEGRDLANRYQWKKTLGPVDQRHLIINRWNTEFAHRPAPDYFQSFGLGFFEYFQLAEDIGAEPLPILNCGMACQFNTAEAVPLNEIDPYVQDALDLIEFANGDGNTTWGKVRVSLGHPAPFNLKMMGIGNENWGPQYIERLKIFQKAIKDKYPNFKLIVSSGTDPGGERFDYLNDEERKIHADIIDEHYYRRPEWFLANAARYDNYPRNGSKIFAGEYAAQSDHTVSTNNKNNMATAISEAAFMTGLERNAAVVNMASYAPLFAHDEAWQWTPDLIWVNNVQSYGTTDYYVQKLFSINKGTNVIPALLNGQPLSGQDNLYVSAVTDKKTNEIIIKVVNASANKQANTFRLDGKKIMTSTATVTTLQSNDLNSENSFSHPKNVAPEESSVDVKRNTINFISLPYSFSVIKLKM
ncbi:MAG: alpha-L-arabinofuranosidase C-terminal domain-containing protein [Ginsengibacter sp.]